MRSMSSTSTSEPEGPTGPVQLYRVGWETLPGLRGLRCAHFRLESAAGGGGVVVELSGPETARALAAELERVFAARWFSSVAAAFEAVNDYLRQRVLRPGQEPLPELKPRTTHDA
jgi:hypothetical protein